MIDNCQMHRSMYPSIFNVQPFPSNSTRKFKSSPFSTFLHILEARLQEIASSCTLDEEFPCRQDGQLHELTSQLSRTLNLQ